MSDDYDRDYKDSLQSMRQQYGVRIRAESQKPAPAQDELIEALNEARDAVVLLEGLCACRGDDDYLVGVLRKIDAALASASASSTEEIEGLIKVLFSGTHSQILDARVPIANLLRTLSTRATAMPVRGDEMEREIIHAELLMSINDRVHIELDEGKPWAEIDNGMDQKWPYDYWKGYMDSKVRWALISVIQAYRSLTAPTHRDDAK